MSDEPTQNTGVILGQRDSDYAGGTLPYEILVPDGNWEAWLPPGEWQRIDALDVMACVTFSALNVLETLYYFKTGVRRNFADRYTARMSGTTPQGNWLWKVGDSIRKDGLAEEADWPTPLNPTWETYYETPPMEVINKAKDFLKIWEVKYEFVDFTRESLIYHLKQSPIQVVFPNHAVMNFFTAEQVYRYFDSYAPFIKERTDGFISALKYVLRPKNNMRFVKVGQDGVDVWLVINSQRSLVYNALAFTLISGNWSSIEVITQAELDAIPDTGKVIAGLDQN